MNLKQALVLSGFVVVLATTSKIVLAEEATVAPVDPALITSSQSSISQKETDLQWAWGEVINLDSQTQVLTLGYLDYETDQEKEMILMVDEKTTFENIKDFSELKLKDTLSVDYLVTADNKNVAQNISFEKPEVSVADLAGVVASDLAQPTGQLETSVDTSSTDNEVSMPGELTPTLAESVPASTLEPVSDVQGQAQ